MTTAELQELSGQLYADRQSNLLGENAEKKLLFLSYNIRLLDFSY